MAEQTTRDYKKLLQARRDFILSEIDRVEMTSGARLQVLREQAEAIQLALDNLDKDTLTGKDIDTMLDAGIDRLTPRRGDERQQ